MSKNTHQLSAESFAKEKLLLQTGKDLSGNTPLLALWHDARGNWEKAHEVVQEEETREAARIHS